VDITRAEKVTAEVDDAISDMFDYPQGSDEQTSKGAAVRNALIDAMRVVISMVPPCPDRSAAIRKIREARMDCNSAITHSGKY